MDIFGTIANAIDLTAKILDYVKSVQSAESDRDDLLVEVSSLVKILPFIQSQVERSHGRPEHEEILGLLELPLVKCAARLSDLEGKLKRGKQGSRWTWPFKKRDLREDFEAIACLNEAIKMILNLNTMVATEAVRAHVEDVKATQEYSLKEKDRLEAIDFLGCNISRQEFEQNLVKRAEGTGIWLTTHPLFLAWKYAKENDAQKVLWCPGPPGAGKSVASAIIVDFLQQEHTSDPATAIIFAFFNYNTSGTYRTLDVIKDLLQQLLRHGLRSPTCAQILGDAMRSGGNLRFAQVLAAFECESNAYAQVFIILDALDEAPEDVRSTFLRSILPLTTTSPIRILATSRDTVPIRRELEAYPRLDIVAQDVDLATYIIAFIAGSKHLKNTLKQSDVAHVTTAILAKSNGMFLLVTLHLQSLDTKVRRRDVLAHLKTLSSDYGDAYGKVMNSIQQQGLDACQMAYQVLGWLFHSHRPMTVLELRYALAIDDEAGPSIDEEDLDSEEVLLNVTAGLVVIYSDSTIEYVHFTVKEYLEHNPAIKHHRDFTSSVRIADTCLAYLSQDFFDDQDFCDGDQEQSDAEAHWNQQYPFLHYAGASWDKHLHGLDSQSPTIHRTGLLLSDPSKLPLMTWCTFFTHKSIPRPHSSPPALHACAALGLDVVISYLLSQPGFTAVVDDFFNPYGATCMQWTALQYAAHHGHLAVLQELRHADVEAGAGTGPGTALVLAARAGHLACVQYLVGVRGANVEARDWADTPLMCASANGHLDVVTYLLDVGAANVEAQSIFGDTALLKAVWRGHLHVVNHLVHNGNACVCRSVLAVHAASNPNLAEIVTYLIQHGADVEARDDEGRTPLIGWSSYGVADVVEALITTGQADINARNYDGETALIKACQEEDRYRLVAYLLAVDGVDIDARDDKNGWTALMFACYARAISVVQLLIEAGADGTTRDGFGRDWTMLACGSATLLEYIVDIGMFDVHACDINGWTPLFFAVEAGVHNEDAAVADVEYLLDLGANVKAVAHDGRSALISAIYHGRLAVVKSLARHWPSGVMVLDKSGKDALAHARLAVTYGKVDCDAKLEFLSSLHEIP